MSEPTPPAPAAAPSAPPAPPADLTPAMRQYRQFKQQHPEYVLFFRMGDFYEMFWEDAKLASRVLGVALTARSKGADAIPMAGVPYHAVEGYLRRMIAAGHKVALCEQMEEAVPGKLVKREVTRLLTPGTLTDDGFLEGRADNHVAAVAAGLTKGGGYRVGLAWIELSTGECRAMSGARQEVLDELMRLAPAELLVAEDATGRATDLVALLGPEAGGAARAVTMRPGWQFTAHQAVEQFKRQWGAATAAGYGFDDDDPAVAATAAVLTYIEETQKAPPSHVRALRRHDPGAHLAIDGATWRALEVERTVRGGDATGSLLGAIDRTRTSMGGRLLRRWLRNPLTDVEHITVRQSAVGALVGSADVLETVSTALDGVCDIERVVGRVAVGRCTPRDLTALGRCLSGLPALAKELGRSEAARELAAELAEMAPMCREVGGYLAGAILAEPAVNLREGGVIARGFDAELDRLHDIGTHSRTWLAEYQSKLAAATGIATLKVSFNKVFGYYIEVTDVHRAKVPTDGGWHRKQTVKNAERYVTEELKRFEEEAVGAAEKAVALEARLFEQVRQALLPRLGAMQELAEAVARLDVLSGLATLAVERKYCRPTVNGGRRLAIVDGRHPVLEQQLGSAFVANDTTFRDDDTLALITGPNMAGKSTFIRQTALIVLMAQAGAWVPAKSVEVGVADRLFARIGASDELHGGRSTFMVEMTETANILNNATDRSLVVLDEIGRGTSTLDGLSLAWAISEHIAAEVRCRTLFATHYHELTQLAERFKGVRNLNVAVREWGDAVVFLHRIAEGGTDRSYGIHVARLAGVPRVVLERAGQLLGELAVQHVSRPRVSKSRRAEDRGQLELFVDPVIEFRRELAGMKIEDLSPAKLYEWLGRWKERLK